MTSDAMSKTKTAQQPAEGGADRASASGHAWVGYDTIFMKPGDGESQEAASTDDKKKPVAILKQALWYAIVLIVLAGGLLIYWMSSNFAGPSVDADNRGMVRLEMLAKQADRIGDAAKDVVTQAGIPATMQETAEQLMIAGNWLQDEVLRLRADRMDQTRAPMWPWLTLITLLLLLAAAVFGIIYLRVSERQQRLSGVWSELDSATRGHLDAERVNQANQAAILRLMDELQEISEGDLTREATVTEDITGAIADSINYTVEKLRALVRGVQRAATSVAQATSKLESGSIHLLKTSAKQQHNIRTVGQAILDMAAGITTMSERAQQSARVANHSRVAAASGLDAVQATISGMEDIRTGIQETSKRMKRLGESSQEIGEITRLISSITEQTNILAMNAAIQAASAGEAGRGFAVVAEEVQRLAERSADATRQIGDLVEAIQTDTQNTVVAMERCTMGVVKGTRLSDKAGAALSEINSVSRELAELIQEISSSALEEAEKANTTTANIQEIFVGTEQTEHSARNSAELVSELARIADELRESAARFKTA